MDLQREEKQRYLRENILDKDYDAEEFMDYCEATRGSVDIDSWTISELKKVSHPVLQLVDDFIRSNSKAFKADPFHVELPRKDPAITIDWDATFSQTIPERKPIDLNCDDLDFLMGFGTTNPATSSTNKPVPSTLKPPASIESPIKSEDLIAAYNPANLTTNSPSAPQLPTGIKSVQIKEPVSQQSTADELRGTIPCKMFQNKPKLAGDYEIVVNGHEIVNPNIFVPNFVLYTLTTNPLNV